MFIGFLFVIFVGQEWDTSHEVHNKVFFSSFSLVKSGIHHMRCIIKIKHSDRFPLTELWRDPNNNVYMASYTRVFLMLLLLILLQEKSEAQLTFLSTPEDVVNVEAGKTLFLNLTFTYTGLLTLTVTWSFNGKTLVQKVGNQNPVSLLPGRVDIEGQGSLVLKNTSLSDNGTYRFSWTGSVTGNDDFKVIILVQPTATLNGSSTTLVQEHGDVYYRCYGKNGVPTSNVSWYRNNKVIMIGEILSIRNITKEQKGIYICKVQSGTLKDETQLKIIVEYKLITMSFKSDQESNIAMVGKNMTLTCIAEGLSSPDYIMLHNDTILTGVVNGVKTINSVNLNHTGHYECVASNNLRSASRSFWLILKELNTAGHSNTGIKWYFILISLICGIFFGMILHCAILSLRQRIKKKKDDTEPPPRVIPETNRESTADNSTYQELELGNREPENTYQALTINPGIRVKNETKIEDEASYQELDKMREDNDNYQSLNRV